VRDPLLYSAGFVSAAMMGPGQAGAYLALFSEIGFIILVTTLAGALGGHWIDGQLHTSPLFILVGLLAGLAIGAQAVYRLIQRFLARFD
jgi:ATP synthase protein I